MALIKHEERYGAYMTSNNAPSPYEASASQNNWGAFRAFSESLDDDITLTGLAAGAEQWVQIKLDAPIHIWAFRICCRTTVSAKDSGQVPKDFTVQGSLDGIAFEDIQAYADIEWTQFTSWDASVNKYDWSDAKKIEIDCQKEYQYYRFVFGECQSISTQKSGDMTLTSSNTVKPTLIDLYQIEEDTTPPTITFQDWDGTVLYTETVEYGGGCYYPLENPTRKGYLFVGWDREDYYNWVYDDILVTAVYANSGEGWTLGEDGTLVIDAGFDMTKYGDPNLGGEYFPWHGSGSTEIRQVIFQDGVTYIGSDIFRECKELVKVTIPDSVTSIGGSAFYGCEKLDGIIIPSGVTEIFYSAFYGCISLSEVIIPKGVEEVFGFAFDGCTSLAKIVFLSATTRISESENTISLNTEIHGYENSTAQAYAQEFNRVFVTLIADTYTVTFKDWDGTILSEQVVNHGADAVPPKDPIQDGYIFTGWDTDFSNVKGNLTVIATYDSWGLMNGTLYVAKTFNEPTYPSPSDYPWYRQNSTILNIVLSDGITNIWNSEFNGCSNLKKVHFPDSITSIGSFAFQDCSSLTEVALPSGVTSIGGGAFYGCTHLSNITIPDGVVSIGSQAFYGCVSLETIILPRGITDISEYLFAGCTKLAAIVIPNSVINIKKWAFFECSSLREILIPESVKDVYPYAFRDCSSLEKIAFYSKDTDISSGKYTISEGAVIYGYSGSTAQSYASKYNRKFVTLDVYTVTFVDWDGTILSEQAVNNGSEVEAPTFPSRHGYFFLGWDKDFSVVTGDMTITAMYDPEVTVVLKPESISLAAGESGSIVVTLLPESLTQIELEWSVTEAGVIEVDSVPGTIKALKPGTATVTVTHVSQQVSASCVVTVEDAIQSLKISKLPDKAEYIIGEAMDLTGLEVTAIWASGRSEQIMDYVVTGFDSSSLGEKIITVEYNGITATFVITVISDSIISIEITHGPTITVYLIGSELNLEGLIVVAIWTSGVTTEIVDYAVSGFDPEQTGEQIVTVTFEDISDTFTVLVKDITGIELITNPNKVRYFVDEKFDATGMKVMAHCTDGTDMDCTSDVNVEFRNGSILEAPAAFGSFREYTVEIPVSVDRAFVGITIKEDVVLTYDFETDFCVVSGTGESGPISGVLEHYKEKVVDIKIEGVSGIAAGYLYGFFAIESVAISAPLELLPSASLQECTQLKKVKLPDTLKEIGSHCFYACISLENIELPDGVELIGSAAFSRSGIREIVMPSDLKTFSTAAFEGCEELQNIILNDGLKEVGHSVFDGCKKLRVLLFPDSVTEINSSIRNLSTLDYVKYPAGMPVIAAPRDANAKTIVIPEGVTSITNGSFYDCDRIEKVFLPNSLKIIENSAFSSCSCLKNISIPESVENVRYGAFSDSGIEEIYFYGRNTIVDNSATIPAGTVIYGYRRSSAEAYCEQFGNVFVPFDDYEYTDEIKALYDTDSIRKRVVIHFANGEARDIENDRIYSESMSLTESICDEENLVFGGCNASKFEIQVADVEEDIRGLEIEVKQYIEEKYVPIFTGIIDSADRQDNRRFKKIIAYDRMYTEGTQDLTSWLKSLTFPMTILDLRYKACEKLGFAQTSTPLVNDYLTINKLSIQAGITGRDILRAICEFNGVFGYMTRMGYFDYISLEKDEQAFPVTGYRKVKFEEYTVQGIESLGIRGSNGDTVLALGSGNKYVLRDNFLVYGMTDKVLQEAANNLLGKIRGIAYRNFSGDGRGLPYILPGRHVQYAVNRGSFSRSAEMVDSYVLKRSLTGIQALKDTYSASGDEFQPDIPANTSTSETARQLEDYVSLDDLDIELGTRFEEFTRGEQYQIDIEAAIQNILQNAGYYKIVSVPELPSDPAGDTIYLIQGEVIVN